MPESSETETYLAEVEERAAKLYGRHARGDDLWASQADVEPLLEIIKIMREWAKHVVPYLYVHDMDSGAAEGKEIDRIVCEAREKQSSTSTKK